MYSHVVNGEVLDYKFRKIPVSDFCQYSFYIGHIRLGSIHKVGKGWSAVSASPSDIGPIHGFRTRLDAAALLVTMYESNRIKI